LHNRHAFGQQGTVIQQQRRNLSFGLMAIIAVFQTFFHQINAIQREIFAALAQGDMGSKRARARFVEQFHR
jgi:hypothetical protein